MLCVITVTLGTKANSFPINYSIKLFNFMFNTFLNRFQAKRCSEWRATRAPTFRTWQVTSTCFLHWRALNKKRARTKFLRKVHFERGTNNERIAARMEPIINTSFCRLVRHGQQREDCRLCRCDRFWPLSISMCFDGVS